MKVAPLKSCKAILVCLLLVGVQVISYSCDSTATLFVSEVKWDELHVLSTVPIKKVVDDAGNSVYEPMCRNATGSPDGIMFNVLFQGTQKKEDEADQDLSIKPGDYVSSQQVLESHVTPELFELSVQCMDTLPDPDAHLCNTNISADKLNIQKVDFYRYLGGDTSEDVALAVLIDMSGSMKGLVDPFPPYREDTFENVTKDMPDGFSFSDNATDSGGSRISAVETLAKTLNKDDQLIIFTFNENKVDVVCDLKDDPDADFEKKKAECFGTNRSLTVDDPSGFSALSSIKGDERGRTPLWDAVDQVYTYVDAHDTDRIKHLLVITDGPDTCSPSSDLNLCSGLCMQYNTEYETVRDKIEGIDFADRLPIHFIQLGARGYTERDPRQQEVACLTGGHFVFVNADEIPKDSLLNVLETTFRRVRYTFRGYWRFAVELAVMKKTNEPDRGWLYALEGTGKVVSGEEKLFTHSEEVYGFKYGEQQVSSFFDRRVSVRKECEPGVTDCGAEEPFNECASIKWWCDEETLTCRSAESWEDNGTPSSCKPREVKITVNVKDGNTHIDYEILTLGAVPTVCCQGRCMPSVMPPVPDELKQPEGMASACFFYTADTWRLEDAENPDSTWVAFADLKTSDQCTWQPFEDFFKNEFEFPDPAGFPLGWEYCLEDGAGENCFPPEGEGDEPEQPPEEEETPEDDT